MSTNRSVFLVWSGESSRIEEACYRLGEGHAVLAQIGAGLGVVPFEVAETESGHDEVVERCAPGPSGVARGSFGNRVRTSLDGRGSGEARARAWAWVRAQAWAWVGARAWGRIGALPCPSVTGR